MMGMEALIAEYDPSAFTREQLGLSFAEPPRSSCDQGGLTAKPSSQHRLLSFSGREVIHLTRS